MWQCRIFGVVVTVNLLAICNTELVPVYHRNPFRKPSAMFCQLSSSSRQRKSVPYFEQLPLCCFTFQSLQSTRDFCNPNRLWGPPNFLFNGCRCSFLGVKRPSRDVGHLPHLMRWVKLSGPIRLLPLYAFMALTVATSPVPFNCRRQEVYVFQRTFIIHDTGQYGKQRQCQFVSHLKRIIIYAHVSFGLKYVRELRDLPSNAIECRCLVPIDCSIRSMSRACFHRIL